MLHPDYQYTRGWSPPWLRMVASGVYDAVLGSRILGDGALHGGMPLYKYVSNRFLTLRAEPALRRQALGVPHRLPRLLAARCSRRLPLLRQFRRLRLRQPDARAGHRLRLPHRRDQLPDEILLRGLLDQLPPLACVYGLGVLRTALQFRLHRWGLRRSRLFEAEGSRLPAATALPIPLRVSRPEVSDGDRGEAGAGTGGATRSSPRDGVGLMAGVGAFTLLALVLRLALAGRGGMWRDEAQMLWIVRSETVRQLLRFLRDHESHPPLFYLLTRAWLGLFGDTEVAALALPVLLGVVLVLALYRTGSETFGRRTGLVAAALAASAPMLAWHSALARPYSLMPLLCLGSVAFLERGLRGGRLRTWVAYAAATLAMLLTHNWGWLVLAGQWAVVLPWLSLRPSCAATLGWLAAQVGIALGFLPWIEAFVYQVRHAGYGGGTPPSMTELVMLLSSLVTANPHHCISLVIVTVLATAAVCRRVYTPRSVRRGPGDATDRGETFALGLLIGVPLATMTLAVLLSSRTNLLIPWTMTTIVPCLFLCCARDCLLVADGPGPADGRHGGPADGLAPEYDLRRASKHPLQWTRGRPGGGRAGPTG